MKTAMTSWSVRGSAPSRGGVLEVLVEREVGDSIGEASDFTGRTKVVYRKLPKVVEIASVGELSRLVQYLRRRSVREFAEESLEDFCQVLAVSLYRGYASAMSDGFLRDLRNFPHMLRQGIDTDRFRRPELHDDCVRFSAATEFRLYHVVVQDVRFDFATCEAEAVPVASYEKGGFA